MNFKTSAKPGQEAAFQEAIYLCKTRQAQDFSYVSDATWTSSINAQIAAMEGPGGYNTTAKEHEYIKTILQILREELAALR